MNRAKFDGMAWPLPDQEMSDIAWRLIQGHSDSIDEICSASVIEAYMELIKCSPRKREAVIREISKSIAEREFDAKH